MHINGISVTLVVFILLRDCMLIVVLDEAMHADFNEVPTRFPFRRRVQSNNTTEFERVFTANVTYLQASVCLAAFFLGQHVGIVRLLLPAHDSGTVPVDVQSAPSLWTFRQKLKTHLFRQSYPDIVFNCFTIVVLEVLFT